MPNAIELIINITEMKLRKIKRAEIISINNMNHKKG